MIFVTIARVARAAIVVKWKTYESENSRWTDVDVAQVIAYSIMEARRLGIKDLESTFKAIAGLSSGIALKFEEYLNGLKKSKTSPEKNFAIQQLSMENFESFIENIKKSIKVLPVIISGGKRNNFPPHPFMYENSSDLNMVAKRFSRLYKIFVGVVVAAEHLTLQLTDLEKLLAEARGGNLKDIREQLEAHCKSNMGYAFNYTPLDILPHGVPRKQEKWPCVTKTGKLFCPFAGKNNACMFYFGQRKSEDFEKDLWKLRYNVLYVREHSLSYYKAIEILFRKRSIVQQLLKDSDTRSYRFIVDIGTQAAYIKNSETVAYYIDIKRGGKSLSKMRFDFINMSELSDGEEENSLIAKRKVREIEEQKKVIGTVKRSVVASLLIPATTSPLLSINTFLMIGDSESDGKEVIYYLYSPSPFLYHNFNLFKNYVNILKEASYQAKVLLFESPVNFTYMELRTIDELQRYAVSLLQGNENNKPMNITVEDQRNEMEILKKINERNKEIKKELEIEAPTREIFGKIFRKE